MLKAHRYSYLIHCGEIPDELYVLHKCDNPSCVNPDHLFLGNADDNAKDRVNKRRYHKMTKLNHEKVLDIRRRYAAGEKQQALADEFGVQNPEISLIVNRKVWAHVA